MTHLIFERLVELVAFVCPIEGLFELAVDLKLPLWRVSLATRVQIDPELVVAVVAHAWVLFGRKAV